MPDSSPHSVQDDFATVRASLGAWQISEAGEALSRVEEQLEAADLAIVIANGQLADLREQLEAAREHLRETVDTAIWMSGSEDFAPNGKGGSEWPKRREFLYAALAFLNSNPARES